MCRLLFASRKDTSFLPFPRYFHKSSCMNTCASIVTYDRERTLDMSSGCSRRFDRVTHLWSLSLGGLCSHQNTAAVTAMYITIHCVVHNQRPRPKAACVCVSVPSETSPDERDVSIHRYLHTNRWLWYITLSDNIRPAAISFRSFWKLKTHLNSLIFWQTQDQQKVLCKSSLRLAVQNRTASNIWRKKSWRTDRGAFVADGFRSLFLLSTRTSPNPPGVLAMSDSLHYLGLFSMKTFRCARHDQI